jgi:hypothetical protein
MFMERTGVPKQNLCFEANRDWVQVHGVQDDGLVTDSPEVVVVGGSTHGTCHDPGEVMADRSHFQNLKQRIEYGAD